MTNVPIYQVDAFTSSPFHGNPAAVCLLGQPAPTEWMQSLAAEMNLSETAFVERTNDSHRYRLRWFTPTDEVQLCGHATMAAAQALEEAEWISPQSSIAFETASGRLTVERNRHQWFMDFPLRHPAACPAPPGLLESLELDEAAFVGRDEEDVLVVLDDAARLLRLSPDMHRLASLPDVRGVIISSLPTDDSSPFDFLSRFFAPAVGIPEDPVTGSAHCCLAKYWSDRLKKSKLRGHQASERGGVVEVRRENERAILSGEAVTVFHGTLSRAVLSAGGLDE